jgi:hypothetical protein
MTHATYPKKPPLESCQQLGTFKDYYTIFIERNQLKKF